MADTSKLTVNVPTKLHRKAKSKAALEGTTLSAMVRGFLKQWVKDPPDDEKTGQS